MLHLALTTLYLALRARFTNSVGVWGTESGLIAVGLGSGAGWLLGLRRIVRRNGPSGESPPILNYALFLRPYPTNGWVTSVASAAASSQLVVIIDPSGRDSIAVTSYLSAALSARSIPQYYWTEEEHWFLAVASAAIHADQLIVEMTDWQSRSGLIRGIHRELFESMRRKQETEVAYMMPEGASAPPWVPRSLVVAYSPRALWYSPRYRRMIARSVREILGDSTATARYLQSERLHRAARIANYLDKLHAAGQPDVARSKELEQLIGDFSGNRVVRRNRARDEEENAGILAEARRLLRVGDLVTAKDLLLLIADDLPDVHDHRTESDDAVQLRSNDFTDFLQEALDEGKSSGKRVDWTWPVYPKTCYLLGWIAMEEKELLSAVSWLKRGLRLSPDDIDLLSELGAAYNKGGLFREALETYSRILALGITDERRARALRGRGYALVELGRLDEARASYMKSLEWEPASEVARAELAEIDALERRALAKRQPPETAD